MFCITVVLFYYVSTFSVLNHQLVYQHKPSSFSDASWNTYCCRNKRSGLLKDHLYFDAQNLEHLKDLNKLCDWAYTNIDLAQQYFNQVNLNPNFHVWLKSLQLDFLNLSKLNFRGLIDANSGRVNVHFFHYQYFSIK